MVPTDLNDFRIKKIGIWLICIIICIGDKSSAPLGQWHVGASWGKSPPHLDFNPRWSLSTALIRWMQNNRNIQKDIFCVFCFVLHFLCICLFVFRKEYYSCLQHSSKLGFRYWETSHWLYPWIVIVVITVVIKLAFCKACNCSHYTWIRLWNPQDSDKDEIKY